MLVSYDLTICHLSLIIIIIIIIIIKCLSGPTGMPARKLGTRWYNF